MEEKIEVNQIAEIAAEACGRHFPPRMLAKKRRNYRDFAKIAEFAEIVDVAEKADIAVYADIGEIAGFAEIG